MKLNPDQWLDREIYIPQKFLCIRYKILVNYQLITAVEAKKVYVG